MTNPSLFARTVTMQIYDSYLLKALDVKLPYSEEPGSNDFYEGLQVKMEKQKIETHTKLRENQCSPKKSHTQTLQ